MLGMQAGWMVLHSITRKSLFSSIASCLKGELHISKACHDPITFVSSNIGLHVVLCLNPITKNPTSYHDLPLSYPSIDWF